jgi:hypothetical protein
VTKRSKEFDLGNTDPKKVYDLLVEILLECVKDPELRSWLNMSLESHSIFSDEPFLGQIRAFAGSQNIAELTCVVSSKSNNTKLNIQSVSRYSPSFWGPRYGYYYPPHKKYIAGLSNELFFRLNHPDIVPLDQTLRADEKVIHSISSVRSDDLRMKCSLTNSRILFSRCKNVFHSIEYSQIENISHGKTKVHNLTKKIFLFSGSATLTVSILCIILVLIRYPPIDYGLVAALLVLGLFTTVALPVGILGFFRGYLSIQAQKDSIHLLFDSPRYPKFFEILNQLLQNSEGTRTQTGMIDVGKNPVPLPDESALATQGICSQCGAKIPPESLFCNKCGASQ